ncbi:MAG: hypothetical protein MMC23_003560 [Stictis urceolatum]|nr:hypothetical protein [Stictis urceolata]
MAKSYFLCPHYDYPLPPDSPIFLGSIISKPSLPESSLNSTARPSIASAIYSSHKTNWELVRTRAFEGRLGIWAEFLQLSGLGGDLGGEISRNSERGWKFERMDTEFFNPSAEMIEQQVASQTVQRYIVGGRFKRPVYMITGLKMVHGAKVGEKNSKGHGGNAKIGADLTATGAPVTVGPDVEYSVEKGQEVSFDGGSDFVFAYRLTRIKYKRKNLVSEEYTKAALFSSDESQSAPEVQNSQVVIEGLVEPEGNELLGAKIASSIDEEEDEG